MNLKMRRLGKALTAFVNSLPRDGRADTGAYLTLVRTLIEISEREGLTGSELGEIMGLSQSAMSRTLLYLSGDVRTTNRKAGLGFIEMRRDPDDRRYYRAYMTERGKKVIRAMTEAMS